MNKETSNAAVASSARETGLVERMMFSEVRGIPAVFIIMIVAAAVFGGVIAFTAKG